MNRRKYRATWLRMQKSYERRAFVIFRSAIRKSTNKVPWDQITDGNYKMLIDYNINEKDILQAFYDVYFTIGSLHGRKVGRGINRDIKAFIPEVFEESFRNLLITFVRDNLGKSITTVRQSVVDYLIEQIIKGRESNLSIQQLAINMKKLANSRTFYKWQALRIARTETTAAANFGAISSATSSGVAVEKEWISAIDHRTRRIPRDRYDHVALNGVKIGKDEKFNDNGSLLLYPGDPEGELGSRINCRCTVAIVPKRDAEGRLVWL